MKKTIVLTIMICSLFVTKAFSQVEIGDATLPNSVLFNEETLILNGAGLREKFWFDLYACGLYLSEKSTSGVDIVNADETMSVRLHILSSLVSKKKLIDAIKKGIDKTNKTSDVVQFKSKIDVFLSLIKNDIKINNVYDLVYYKGEGLTFFENGVNVGQVEGLAFKKILFNVWLAETPVDSGLKKEILGVD